MKAKKSISVVLIFLLGAIAGAAAGACITIYFASLFLNDASVLQDAVSVGQNTVALQLIRERKIDLATEVLEVSVDGNLIRYSFGLRGSRHTRQTIKSILKSVKEYREKYPRSTERPKIDEAVARALANADE